MITITSAIDLVKFFDGYKSATRAKIVTRTPVTMRKKDIATREIENPFTEVYKVQTVEVELNANYEQKVNDQRMLEGAEQSFEAGGRAWGKHVNGAIVEKNGTLYLHTIEIGRIGKPKYETKTGREVNYEEIKPFIPAYNGTPGQGLVEEVKVRDYKLMNVIGVNIDNKVRYINA